MAERPQNKRKSSIDYHPEMHAQDVNNHEVFQNNRLASQFLRNYTGISIFQNVQEEDLEDITKRYRAFLGVEFESDTIKKVYVHSADGMVKEEIYVISLIVLYGMIIRLHGKKSVRDAAGRKDSVIH